MSWLSKHLKKKTKILDPIGSKLRKSTGGSYGDPLNWYNSKPNTNQPWQPSPSKPLMAAPNGQQTLGTTNIGGNDGGRTYTPNYFINPGMQNPVPGLTAPQGGKGGMGMPAGPIKQPPNMGFGGGVGGGANPQMIGMAPPQQAQPQMQNNMMGQQQAMIQALRGRMM